MAYRLKQEYAASYQMRFGFANTGLEHEKTLEFAHRCDSEWGLNLVWLEAVTHVGERKGCTHKIVDFKTAARQGEPFEGVIEKYGIPNKAYPHCTRELKLNPIRSYLDSIGWTTGSYISAVGIRADEPKRVRKDPALLYPMVHLFPTTKPEINDWWESQSFDLGLADYQGNCKTCWKKSNAKLIRIAKETPNEFDFMARMEQMYGLHGHNIDGNKRVFFRSNTSTAALLQIAGLSDRVPPVQADADEDSGCSESCEAFV